MISSETIYRGQNRTRLTFAVHVGIEIQLCNVVGRRRLDPDALPDTAAGLVEDMAFRGRLLLADRDDIVTAVGGIMDEYEPVTMLAGLFPEREPHLQFIILIQFDVLCDVDREAEISAAIEARLFPIDKDGRFVIDRAKIQQHILALPVARDLEVGVEPGVICVFPLDPCIRPLARVIPLP